MAISWLNKVGLGCWIDFNPIFCPMYHTGCGIAFRWVTPQLGLTAQLNLLGIGWGDKIFPQIWKKKKIILLKVGLDWAPNLEDQGKKLFKQGNQICAMKHKNMEVGKKIKYKKMAAQILNGSKLILFGFKIDFSTTINWLRIIRHKESQILLIGIK